MLNPSLPRQEKGEPGLRFEGLGADRFAAVRQAREELDTPVERRGLE